MTTFDVRVDTESLRRALISVLPHAGTDPDVPALARLRVYVLGAELAVVATDRYTAGLAKVDVFDTSGELGAFDLSPADATKVIGLFKVPKDMLDQSELRVQWDEKSVQFTDVSGMFDAEQSLALPALPVDEQFPLLATFFRQLRRLPKVDNEFDPEYMSVNANYLVRFGKAASAYTEPLVIETVGKSRALIITCSSQFIGLLMPHRQDEEQIQKYTLHRSVWRDSMGLLAAAHPQPAPRVTPEQLLLERARALVVREQKCGRTFLCTELDVTQRQARDLLEKLETEGIVGPVQSNGQQRQVLVSAPLFDDEDGAE